MKDIIDFYSQLVIILFFYHIIFIELFAFWTLSGGILVPYFMLFVAFEQWAGAVTLFYPTELYPTPVRAVGQGFATEISRVASVLGVFYFPILTKQIGFIK